jgi:hypothetical protein
VRYFAPLQLYRFILYSPKIGAIRRGSNIVHKFQFRGAFLTQKRVTKKLRRAGRLMQSKANAGLSGVQKGWHSYSTAIAKGRERNGNVKENINITNTNNKSCSVSNTVRARDILFYDSLVNTLPGAILGATPTRRLAWKKCRVGFIPPTRLWWGKPHPTDSGEQFLLVLDFLVVILASTGGVP